jgi:exonuclease III
MDNLDNESVLRNYGGLTRNSLFNKLDLHDDDEYEMLPEIKSPYLTMDMVVPYIYGLQNPFSTLSLNCQSINSKFGSLQTMLHNFENSNFYFDIVCLQETWIKTDDCAEIVFKIPGYNMVNTASSVGSHGGLITYLRENLNYSIKAVHIPSSLWECQLLNVSGESLAHPLTIANIYRPPRHNNSNATIAEFIKELSEVLNNNISNKDNSIITGDFKLANATL